MYKLDVFELAHIIKLMFCILYKNASQLSKYRCTIYFNMKVFHMNEE